ncbi:MAG: hypothetical protein ACI8QD_002038 [Cyclobacteriaceae bacterium]|jgi:hypothetical protein
MKNIRGFKKVMYAGLVLLLACNTGYTQDQQSSWEINLGLGTGFRLPNNFGLELNAVLSDNESYPQLATNVSLGFWRAAENSNLRLGGEVISWFYPAIQGFNARVSQNGLGGSVKVGYEIWGSDIWHAIPYIGLGSYWARAQIENQGFLVNRDPLFIPPGSQQVMAGRSTFIDIGATLSRKTLERFTWSLSGGLQQRIAGSNWKSSWGESIDYLSEPTFSVIYVKIVFGLTSL